MTKVALTELQKGMLLDLAAHPQMRHLYVVQTVFDLQTSINLPYLKKSFQQLCTWHQALRSTIQPDNSVEIVDEVELPFSIEDLTDMPDAHEHIDAFLLEDKLKAFDLTQAPLMRIHVFILNPNHFKMVWTRHHLILDGRSVYHLIDQLFDQYLNLLNGGITQNSNTFHLCTSTPLLAKQSHLGQDYFKKHLEKHSQAALAPPHCKDYNYPACTQSVKQILQPHSLLELTMYCEKNDINFSSLLQSAWALTLSRYTQTPTVAFGFVRSQPSETVENKIGLFINTLPVCIDLKSFETKYQLLDAIKNHCLKMREFVSTPLHSIRKAAQIPIGNPLFETLVDYKPYSINELMLKKYTQLRCHIDVHIQTHYAVVLEAIKIQDGLILELNYQGSHYNRAYMQRMLEHFKTLLFSLVDESTSKLSKLPSLPAYEYEQVTTLWNQTDKTLPTNLFVHSLIENQAQKMPYKTALIRGDDRLTYQAMNEKANQLAHFLIKQRVLPGDCVAIYTNNGFDRIIAALAILKSGGAYYAIDPALPAKRIEYLLTNAGPKYVIQSEMLNLPLINSNNNHTTPIVIEHFWEKMSKDFPITNPSALIKFNHTTPAYMIYTSGTTGKPKGVVVSHQSMLNMIMACGKVMEINAESRILQIAACSFDVAVAEWSIALSFGASLHFIPEQAFSPLYVAETMRAEKITSIILATSILCALPKTSLPHLKTILAGGELCDLNTINFWSKKHTLINGYGTAECSVCSLTHVYHPNENVTIIGRPLTNHKVYILDETLRPVPIGVPGEIYIGGAGVALGYLGEDKPLVQRFFNNPFVKQQNPYQRLYRTGDKGCWLENGEVMFLGRIDNQIKLHGHRIEPEEIERCLEGHHDVIKACVLLQTIAKQKRLVAYVQTKNENILEQDLREYASSMLPTYLIPHHFISITQWPLTVNGKIDKPSLPLPKLRKPTTVLESHTLYETKIIQAIQTLAPFNAIPLDRNFIALGLDSLDMVSLATSLSKSLKQPVEVTTLFTHPNIQLLAKALEANNHNLSLLPDKHITQHNSDNKKHAFAQKRRKMTESTSSHV